MLSCRHPKDAVVSQVLSHLGIFSMLGERGRVRVSAEDVIYWKVHGGTEADGERANDALIPYEDLFSDPDKARIYRGITEAMTNCRQHAYEGRSDEGWWMYTQLKDNVLSVAFADLGIGIPVSLSSREDSFKRNVSRYLFFAGLPWSDGNCIRAALELGRSRTGRPNRGKGLPDIRAVVDRLDGGLIIHSNDGLFHLNSATKKAECRTFSNNASFQGTIIVWAIPVPRRESE